MRTYNIKKIYVDKGDPWSGTLFTEDLATLSISNGLKGYSTVELVFGRDKIILIKHTAY